MNYLGLAMLHALAVLPHGLVKILSRVSAWTMWRANGRLRRVTEHNLAICFPERPEEERAKLARSSLYELNLRIFEMGATWLWSAERIEGQIKNVVGEEHLLATVENGTGTLLLAPHLGTWETVNIYLCERYEVTTLYRRPKSAFFDDVIREARERNGAKLVPTDVSGVRALLKALKSNTMVTILPDQVPPRKMGAFAPFFGEPTLTMTLATNLIHRTGAKAVCAYCKRLPDGRFDLVFRPVDEGIYDPDNTIALAALNKSVEQCVMDCPEQYQWQYKRFKYLPDLQKRDYRIKYDYDSSKLRHRQA